MLFFDGVYVGEAGSCARFRWVKAPTCAELTQLSHTIAHRLARYLERQGLLVRDAEHSYLTLDNVDEDPAVISKILKHLQEQSPLDSGVPIPNSRAPPQARLFS